MCNTNCTNIAVIVSVILGVVTAILSLTAVIAPAPLFAIVIGVIAIVYLAVTLIAVAIAKCRGLRRILNYVFTGILGSILTSIIILAFAIVSTTVIGAIFTGVLVIFATLMILSTVCLIKCFAYNGVD